jgi:hypothetical protein
MRRAEGINNGRKENSPIMYMVCELSVVAAPISEVTHCMMNDFTAGEFLLVENLCISHLPDMRKNKEKNIRTYLIR